MRVSERERGGRDVFVCARADVDDAKTRERSADRRTNDSNDFWCVLWPIIFSSNFKENLW